MDDDEVIYFTQQPAVAEELPFDRSAYVVDLFRPPRLGDRVRFATMRWRLCRHRGFAGVSEIGAVEFVCSRNKFHGGEHWFDRCERLVLAGEADRA